MPTDLRAALRDNTDTLRWLLIDQQERQHDEIDADDGYREKRQRAIDVLTRLFALADAPPTVAELLAALPDPPDARTRAISDHAARWAKVAPLIERLREAAKVARHDYAIDDEATVDPRVTGHEMIDAAMSLLAATEAAP